MATQRQRAVSPQAPRVYVDTPRASTGTMLTASYDTRFDSRPRASFSTVGSARDSLATRSNSVYETQPVSKKTYVDPSHGGGTISRTQYTVKPRRDSDIAETRRPLSLATKNVSPTRERGEILDSPQQMVVYNAPRDEGSGSNASRYLQPAQTRGSPHHQRHSSASRAETGQFYRGLPPPRPEKEYHRRGPYVEKVADSRPPPVRYSDDDGFSYTGPREQFARDYPVRPGRRESLSRRERPTSAMDTKFEPAPFRRDTAPPPSSSRQLDRIERDDRKSGFESDPDRSRPERKPRRSMKGPVVHQRDDGYSSAQDYDPRRASRARPQEDEITTVGKNRYRDGPREAVRENPREPPRDFERERERERERPRKEYDREEERPVERDLETRPRRQDRNRDREYEKERRRPKEPDVIEEEEPPRRPRRQDSSPDRSHLKSLATAAVGGLAAVGIANRKSGKDDDVSDSDSRRERKHRRRKPRDHRDDEKRDVDDPDAPRRRRERRSHREGSSGSDTSEERTRVRPQSRTRNRRDTMEGYGSEREKPQLALPAPEPDRRPAREPEAGAPRSEQIAEPVPRRAQQESPINDENRPMSPGEGSDSRPRKVSIVEPLKKEDFKPRGILKPPRAVPFPEDPNPTREGVAPLKQAGKDGIPSGARWTKVSRILVNPEALEKTHERYEERDDYVIVLRVLSREEIEKLAEKTKEIREQREREWQTQVEERRHRRSERGERDSEHEDDYDDAPRGPLAIEAPPSAQPIDLRQLAAQNSSQQAPPPQQGYPPQFPWNAGGSAKSSGEAIANTAPGQPVPQQMPQQPHLQQEFDASTYSQNV